MWWEPLRPLSATGSYIIKTVEDLDNVKYGQIKIFLIVI